MFFNTPLSVPDSTFALALNYLSMRLSTTIIASLALNLLVYAVPLPEVSGTDVGLHYRPLVKRVPPKKQNSRKDKNTGTGQAGSGSGSSSVPAQQPASGPQSGGPSNLVPVVGGTGSVNPPSQPPASGIQPGGPANLPPVVGSSGSQNTKINQGRKSATILGKYYKAGLYPSGPNKDIRPGAVDIMTVPELKGIGGAYLVIPNQVKLNVAGAVGNNPIEGP